MQDQRLIASVLRTVDHLAAVEGLERVLEGIAQAEPLKAIGTRGVAFYLADGDGRTVCVAEPSAAAPDVVARAGQRGTIEVDLENRIVAVPIGAGDERFGVLALLRSDAWRPTADERIELQLLGSVLGLAVSRAKAHDRERQLRARIDVLRHAGAALAERLSIVPAEHLRAAVLREFRLWPSASQEQLPEFLESALQAIVEHAARAVRAEFGALGVGESPSRAFNPWVFYGISDDVAKTIGHHPRPVGTLGLVAREGRVMRIADVRRHPAFGGFPSGHPEVRSLLAVPLRYGSVSFGNLYLGNKIGASEFDEHDQEVIELLASQATLSLQQAYFRAAIDSQRAQLQIILDGAPHGLLFVDARTGEVVANPKAMQLLSTPIVPTEGRAQYVDRVRRPDGRPLGVEELPSSRALAGTRVADEELLIVDSNGRRTPIVVSAAPVMGLDQRILGAVVSFADISAIKELERTREEFAAVVAHDLRDPVQAMLFQVDLILRHADKEMVTATAPLLRGLERSAQRLGQLADELVDASRVELGRVSLEKQRLDAPAAVGRVVAAIGPELEGHPVAVEVQGPAPAVVWADPARLDQIMTNLLENAAKYSDPSSPITVHVRADGDGTEIAVEDRGVGISPDELPRLFDRFYQAGRARERKTGLGLGLYITKGLVEAHGGRLQVDSAPGRGSVFTVWLPGPGADAARGG